MKEIIIGLFIIMMIVTFLVILVNYQEQQTRAIVTYNQSHMMTNQDKILSKQDIVIMSINNTNSILHQILSKMK